MPDHSPSLKWKNQVLNVFMIIAISYLQRLIHNLKNHFDETITTLKERVPLHIVLGEWFYFVVFVVMMAGYPRFCQAPYDLERMNYDEAANYISALSKDQENTEILLSEVRSSDWYDDNAMLEKPDVDILKCLQFIYKNLRNEAVEKECISPDADGILYEISKWYLKYR